MKFLTIFILLVSFLFGLVDINNASLKELRTLKGIGEVKSNAIVMFRKGHCFKNVSELSLVKGIGIKTILKNKNNVEVGICK